MKRFIFAALFCIIFIANTLYGEIIRVPGDQPMPRTIQEAINSANEGDTVLVADGFYTGEGNKNLDFLGKAIMVKSENGPENCTIDCEHEGRGFYFHRDEKSDSILDGFTIMNGVAPYGGGICCNTSSPTIINNFITGNTATRS